MAGGGTVFLIVYLSSEKLEPNFQSKKNQKNKSRNGVGHGIGHQKRCEYLKSLISKGAANSKKKATITLHPFRSKQDLFSLVDFHKPDVIVFDVREKIDAKIFSQLKKRGLFIFLLDSDDEKAIGVADYHVRTLPFPPSLDFKKKSMANLFGLAYLPIKRIKKNTTVKKRKTKKIIVYLGSFFQQKKLLQNYLDLFQTTIFSEKFWRSSKDVQSVAPLKETHFHWIFIVDGQEDDCKKVEHFFSKEMQGYLTKHQKNFIKTFGIIDQKKLFNFVSDSDLFLTHFGLSFLQAVDMGSTTALLLPTSYHSNLSRFHFPNSVLVPDSNYRLLQKATLTYGKQMMLGQKKEKLAATILQLAKKKTSDVCPYCESKKIFALYRKPNFSWMYCNNCQSASQQRYGLEKIFPENFPNYSSDYFQKEYEKSYGKTYKQDEANIKKMAAMRLAHIKQLLGSTSDDNQKKWVLDIGTAYGFFLDVASYDNFLTAGIEISKHAARFISPRHRMFFGDVEKLNFKNLLKSCQADHFEIISMWYVIEHFPILDQLLKNLSMCQKRGDVFALSTPNFRGISARKNREMFIKNSPVDHFHLFSARGLAELLKRYGYQLVKIVSTGIHKKRYQHFFPYLSKIVPFSLYSFFAQKNNWGDTMELYFLKK